MMAWVSELTCWRIGTDTDLSTGCCTAVLLDDNRETSIKKCGAFVECETCSHVAYGWV